MAFVLKEAFRYQNLLESLIQSCDCYLRNSSNVMKVTEEHLRSKVVPEAQDEKKDNIADRPLAVSADTLISFMFRVYLEKESLSKAINDAKNQHCADMDMNMALNKTRQRIVDRLKSIAALKSRRTTGFRRFTSPARRRKCGISRRPSKQTAMARVSSSRAR